jgi:hypothetical protein
LNLLRCLYVNNIPNLIGVQHELIHLHNPWGKRRRGSILEFPPNDFKTENLPSRQGDQIRPVFAEWAIVYFGLFLNNRAYILDTFSLSVGTMSVPLMPFSLMTFPLTTFPLMIFPLMTFPLMTLPLTTFPLTTFPLTTFPLTMFPLNVG